MFCVRTTVCLSAVTQNRQHAHSGTWIKWMIYYNSLNIDATHAWAHTDVCSTTHLLRKPSLTSGERRLQQNTLMIPAHLCDGMFTQKPSKSLLKQARDKGECTSCYWVFIDHRCTSSSTLVYPIFVVKWICAFTNDPVNVTPPFNKHWTRSDLFMLLATTVQNSPPSSVFRLRVVCWCNNSQSHCMYMSLAAHWLTSMSKMTRSYGIECYHTCVQKKL